MTELAELKARLMADPEFREEYAKADVEYALIESLVRARNAARLSQAELARRIGTTQSAIAGSNDTSLAVVAPGIAEALFATALGLVAAIPAVVLYNKFSTDLGRLAQRFNAAINEAARQFSRANHAQHTARPHAEAGQ